MKRFAFLFALLFALTFTVNAQTTTTESTPTAEKHRGKGKDKMKEKAQSAAKELNLNDEQKSKMKTIASNYKSKLQAVRTDNSLSKEQKRAQLKEINAANDAEIKTVLSPEQYTQWADLKKNRQEKMKEHKGKRAGTSEN
jgi:periplasmic protein CpxP/Spy